MKKETLNAVGLGARMDIPAEEIFSAALDYVRYGLDSDDLRKARVLKDFVCEYNREIPEDRTVQVTCSDTAARLLYPIFRSLDHEEVWVMYLNRDNRVVDRSHVCSGALDETVIDKRRIVRTALDLSATGVILFHNHPSGNPRPSASDIRMTDELRKCLNLFDMSLTDHIVVSDTSYYSFADEGVTRISNNTK